jgi:hypothetical protein
MQDDDRLSTLTGFLAKGALIGSLGLLFFSLVQTATRSSVRIAHTGRASF